MSHLPSLSTSFLICKAEMKTKISTISELCKKVSSEYMLLKQYSVSPLPASLPQSPGECSPTLLCSPLLHIQAARGIRALGRAHNQLFNQLEVGFEQPCRALTSYCAIDSSGASALALEWKAGIRAKALGLPRSPCRTPIPEKAVLTMTAAIKVPLLVLKSLRYLVPFRL